MARNKTAQSPPSDPVASYKFTRGEKVTVTGREQRQISVQRADGSHASLTVSWGNNGRAPAPSFDVYEAGKLPLAPGERIRITQNGQTKDGHRVNNGELRSVRKFTAEGDIVLDNGWVLDKNFGNLAHGYCVTSHSSQGKTIQRLFVAECEASLPAASREQFYVSASRGVEAIKIYTDNKDALMDAVAVSGERPSDLVQADFGLTTDANFRREAFEAILRQLFAGRTACRNSQTHDANDANPTQNGMPPSPKRAIIGS